MTEVKGKKGSLEPPLDLIPFKEAAALYGLSTSGFRARARIGHLSIYSFGYRTKRVSRAEVLRDIEECRLGGPHA